MATMSTDDDSRELRIAIAAKLYAATDDLWFIRRVSHDIAAKTNFHVFDVRVFISALHISHELKDLLDQHYASRYEELGYDGDPEGKLDLFRQEFEIFADPKQIVQ